MQSTLPWQDMMSHVQHLHKFLMSWLWTPFSCGGSVGWMARTQMISILQLQNLLPSSINEMWSRFRTHVHDWGTWLIAILFSFMCMSTPSTRLCKTPLCIACLESLHMLPFKTWMSSVNSFFQSWGKVWFTVQNAQDFIEFWVASNHQPVLLFKWTLGPLDVLGNLTLRMSFHAWQCVNAMAVWQELKAPSIHCGEALVISSSHLNRWLSAESSVLL